MSLSISEAAAKIRRGELVAFPTETVYGLGANALDPQAVARIYQLKQRPASSPLIVHVASIEMARRITSEWPPVADNLAREWWPGPLTLVLPKAPAIPDIVTAGLPTVGVRMPDHPIALELIVTAGVPIAAPSANRFTGLSPTTADHVRDAFDIDVLEGGPTRVGIESTVVAIENGKPKLLRPGMISLGDLEQAAAPDHAAHPAPGMHPKHYSPRTPLLLIQTPAELPDDRGAYLWRKNPGKAAHNVHMPATPPEYAARLYAVLHEVDAGGWPWIAVEAPPAEPAWSAILDRLRRAAATGR